MTSIVNLAEAKAKALEIIAEEDFKKAVAAAKLEIQARRLHLLPWKIVFQWPIKLVSWTAAK